jgi:hypothetical protein
MRGLKIICGISVLILAVHMLHPIHHFFGMRNEMAAGYFWGLVAVAFVSEIFSVIGGVFLIAGK